MGPALCGGMRLRMLQPASLEKHHLQNQSMILKKEPGGEKEAREQGRRAWPFSTAIKVEAREQKHWPSAVVSQLRVDYVGQLQRWK